MQSGMSMHDTMAFMVMFLPVYLHLCIIVVSGQSICYEQLWARFVQYSHAVLMDLYLYDKLTTSFLKFDTSSLRSVIIPTSCANQ